ncbi:MAG: peptide chain release factor N(5)-glutamine methyltransferase [Clostridiales Family XIII bacterium]|jgi:release factor glutamine methyltransferase|nr:peptide chain release factor N(5)-glutamine methyltransferase [Clostridiales Family XIII bacterium]
MGIELRDLLANGERILSEVGDSDAKKDSELLLQYTLNYDDTKVFMNWTKDIDDGHCEVFFELIEKRSTGIPTQYLTNEQEFYGLKFYVDEHVLIPRMDTEVLVERVLADAKSQKKSKFDVLDLCTGSGAIGITIAHELPSSKVVLSDISEEALKVAQRNIASNNVIKRVKTVKSDMYDAHKLGKFAQKYDIITCNPPYIRSDVIPTLMREVKDHEPMRALDGGESGLDFYEILAEKSFQYLKKDGRLYMEIGYDQGEAVSATFAADGHYKDIEVIQDLAGLDRIVLALLK